MLTKKINTRVLYKLSASRYFSAYDLVVIGGGPGGYVSSIRAGQNGLKTVCVESRGALGGTCLNVGCIPSKALLNISHKYHDISHSKEYGINVTGATYDWDVIQGKKTEIVSGLTKGIEFLLKKNKVDYKKGHGKIIAPGKVEVKGADGKTEIIETKNILIATGSEPTPFPGIPFDEKIFISSTGALSLAKVPETMTVIGAGVIGLELGSVYARLGTKVDVIEYADNICPFMDDEISKAFLRSMKKQGLNFKLGTKVNSGKIVDGKAQIEVESNKNGKKETITSDVCLVAIGRLPYTTGLGAKELGIEINKKGQIEITDHFQTSVNGIYAIGDVVPGPMLAHKSEEEGVACVDLLAGKDGHVNYNCIPSVVYTHPEVAWVGRTEQDCKKEGKFFM